MRERDLEPLEPDWVVVHTDQWRGVVAVTGRFTSRQAAQDWLEHSGRPGVVTYIERTREDWYRTVGLPVPD